jgi:hypothetical protein|tara:strand:+ start:295 stop:558 length:264 start_codon:yes stop_codon:yes gene_type:complete
MTQQQMIDMVRQHHPNVTETQARLWLNAGLDEFSRRTRMLTGAFTFSTVADQRWYGLSDDVLEIISVDYDGYDIPRLGTRPEIRDLT